MMKTRINSEIWQFYSKTIDIFRNYVIKWIEDHASSCEDLIPYEDIEGTTRFSTTRGKKKVGIYCKEMLSTVGRDLKFGSNIEINQ